ncbi:MAG: VWA domain-containing protein [Pyrinomonadaceae bacterium]
MGRSLSVLVAIAFFIVAVSGQSGRRVKQAGSTAQTPPVQRTAADGGFDEEAKGYSESAPSRSVPLSRTSRSSKKETKKPAVSPTPDKPADVTESDVIRVETNLVTIPVSVSNRDGFYVANLRQADFKIFEDGVEQKIEYFGTTDKPFTVVLLIDVSPSTSYKIEEIQAAAWAFVQQLMPHDRVMVVQFDSSVDVLAEPTGDREKIAKAIRKTGFGNGTALYEAVERTLNKYLAKIDGRKAVVLFTDGVDTTSWSADYVGTLEDAEESEAVIFPIYYNTFLQTIGIGGGGVMSTPPTLGLPGSIGGTNTQRISEEYARGRAYLTELAGVTGGKLFRAESTPGGLSAAFESIAEELRRQYVLGFYPEKTGSPGTRRSIRVRVDKPKLIIRARDSYIVNGG